jgi:hypothetical protein
MAEVRQYEADVNLDEVAEALDLRLRSKGFATTIYPQGDGYILSAKKTDIPRMAVGLGREATVTLMPSDTGFVVTVDRGDLASQVIGGALGYLFCWPLMGVAAYGAYKRHALADEVFAIVDQTAA